MNIDINAFNQPLLPLPIVVGGQKLNLSSRFLEIDLPFQPVTNLDMSVKGSALIKYYEGILALEIRRRDAPVIVAYALYAKYFGSNEPDDDNVILTDIVTDSHQDEITALFHNWCKILTGTEPIVLDDLSVVRGYSGNQRACNQ